MDMETNVKKTTLAIAAAGLTGLGATAMSTASPVGIVNIQVAPNSDVFVGVPYAVEFEGTFTATGNNGTDAINVAAATFTAGEFDDLYYIRMQDGTAEGKWATIDVTNTGDVVLSDTSFVTDVANGDTFKVYRHTTVESAFPDELEGISFKAQTGFAVATELFLPQTTNGINKSAGTTLRHNSQGQWVAVAGGELPAGNADDVVLAPGSALIVRNQNTSDTLNIYFKGDVETGPRMQEIVVPSTGNDNDLSIIHIIPVDISFDNLKLAESSAFTPNVGFGINDEIFVFDNSDPQINKSASATYRVNSSLVWQRVGSGNADDGSDILPAGAAVIFRKKGVGAGSTEFWDVPSPF